MFLLGKINDQSWLEDIKRRVQHYGNHYDYKVRRVTGDAYLGPLPDWLAAFANRLWQEGLFDEKPDQVTVNEYLPGQGIAEPVDCDLASVA